ncbi:hypothetical protein LQZ18_16665 [Lachnospiraceae bacterium ZAX-1]
MKKLFKTFMILMIAIAIFGGMGVQAHAQFSLIDSSISSMSPRSDIIEWRYKVKNEKLYKRLFNYTDDVWVGKWILMS